MDINEELRKKMVSDRLIFHIDVNSAFLSWEAAKRVSFGQDDLRQVPSVVSGDPNKRTSIICAGSIPAKKLGIKTGEPLSMAFRKCPNLIVVTPDFALYSKNSKAFMDICRQYAPVVEKYSIDECFLDMTGTGLIYKNPVETAYEIKDKIRDTLGFTVNVGIGSNKLLAKMASDFEKPDKVHILLKEDVSSVMWPLPVGDLFMVGKSSAARLEKIGIKTIGQLANYEEKTLCAMLGEKKAQQAISSAKGIDDTPVCDEKREIKSYGNTTTLEEDVTTSEKAYEVLRYLADTVSFRMRMDGAKAYVINVTIRGNDFKDKSHQCSLIDPTDITKEIYQVSKDLFDEIWDKKMPIRLLGISLTKLTKEEPLQMSFLMDKEKEKAKKLDSALDSLKNKYGTKIVERGSELSSQSDRVGRRFKAEHNEKSL